MLVVTVCTANLCRSPFAARVLERAFVIAGIEAGVASTGVEVSPGATPPSTWVDVAGEYGIDLRTHRSVAPDQLVGTADLLLTMTAEHSRILALRWPSTVGRVLTLGEAVRRAATRSLDTDVVGSLVGPQRGIDLLMASPADDVPDPIGRMRRFQRSVAGHIVQLCEDLAAAWPA